MPWFQCTKGHKWWIQGRADAFPDGFRDGIHLEQLGEPFALCLWCLKELIGFVTPLTGVEEPSTELFHSLGEEIG